MIVLGAKTDYSFLRGYGTPKQWLTRSKDIGVRVLGIADYCSTWGHAPFRDAFKDSGIKLLYGVQLPVVATLSKDPRHSLVTLYARNGLEELYRAVSLAHAQTYYRPRLSWKQLLELTDCFVVVNNLLRNEKDIANTLDPEHSFVGVSSSLTDHLAGLELQQIVDYSPRFPAADDRVAFGIFQSISSGQRIGEIEADTTHMLRSNEVARFLDQDEDFVGEANDNAAIIAYGCAADIPSASLLAFPVEDKRAKLDEMAMDGAIKLGLAEIQHTKHGNDFVWNDALGEYKARLDRELDVIVEKNFEDYFFFVADITSWADQRMLIGPGRGSAGGSLLCYLLGITHVDPLRFGTMFDRFIDITRSDLPDIDIDFPDNRREEVFEYMKAKYGADCFARLGTLSELGGKSALNAVARAHDIPFDASREVGKYTEGAGQGAVVEFSRVFRMEEVKPILERHPSLLLAEVIDGHVSHHGVHASGVVVTEKPVATFGTVDREGVLAMDMKTAEKQGFVKMDVLGLKTLTVIQECCDLVGIDPRSLRKLDWDDVEVFDTIFNKDAVTGIFQFEGNAVRGLMKGITVDKFDDLCALTSLARPGPLVGGAAAGWVKSRNGEAARESIHPSLDTTYGVICYQEQMMNICRDCAGFDIPAVNGMRRAVAKKDPEKLAGYRPAFIAGMKNHFICKALEKPGGNHDHLEREAEDKAAELWEEICEFGSYAFNLAHAVAYAMLSFMAAWLKCKHPLEFAVAQLKYAADEDTAKHLLRELTEEGYKYVPFDAKISKASWSINDGALVGGFDSIRGIGTKTAERYEALRAADPDFWMEELTEAQRVKIMQGKTAWHDLSYFAEKFPTLYKDPDSFRCSTTPKGIKPPVYRIRDIPEAKGEYAFLGRVTSVKHVDANEPERVAKRDGKKFTKDTHFINLKIEDDTGELGATINRFKAAQFLWLVEEDLNGRDFLFRGNVIEAGRKWLFIEKVLEIK